MFNSWGTRRAVALAVVTLTLPLGLASANAAEVRTMALWQTNEPPGARTMTDSSGNVPAMNGEIGSAVRTGVLTGGETAYQWPFVRPEEWPPKPERLIQVWDDRLNLGNQNFAISFRYKTTRPFGNIMQKGQAKTVGGQIKFQLPKGNVTCLIRGAAGRRAVRSSGVYRDGQWHTVRCERNATGIVLTITDPQGNVVETRRLNGPTGFFQNRFPWTIGGKFECDQITVTCDYYTGEIDWVRIEVW